MGWAKYAEDINEIVFERMDQLTNSISPYTEIIRSTPLTVNPARISIVVNSNKEQVAQRAKCEDRTLQCIDCGKAFVFSASEKRFYEKKGFHQPKRCKDCRESNAIKQFAFR